MMRWLVICGLVLSGGVALANNQDSSKGALQMAPAKVPSGAKLIGSTSTTEVRSFPELAPKSTENTQLVGARAVDQVYEAKKSYKDTVSFYDQLVKSGQADQLRRTVTRTSTGWMLQLPDGTLENVVVRNTQPTTIETVKATAAAGEMDQSGSMKKGQENGAQPMQQQQPQQQNPEALPGHQPTGSNPGTEYPGRAGY